MTKENRLNIVLFIVAIVLASIIYFSDEKDTALDRLTAIDITSINNVTITHNKNQILFVKQKNSTWHITSPISIAANDFRINSILKLLNAPVHKQYPANTLDLNSIGLKTPTTSLQLNELRFDFGITNPATNLRYVRLNNSIFTIEDVYYPLLSSHFGSLVSLKLLPENNELVNGGIKKLILLNQTIAKNEKGLWVSNAGISADKIAETIDYWLHKQAFAVHEYLPREELGEIFIYLKNRKQPLSYLVTDIEPWLIIARPELGLEYHLDIEAYKQLLTPQ